MLWYIQEIRKNMYDLGPTLFSWLRVMSDNLYIIKGISGI